MALAEHQQGRNQYQILQVLDNTDQRSLSPKLRPFPNAVVNP